MNWKDPKTEKPKEGQEVLMAIIVGSHKFIATGMYEYRHFYFMDDEPQGGWHPSVASYEHIVYWCDMPEFPE